MWRLACARYEALSIDPLDIGIPQGHVLEVWRGGLLHSELGTTMDGLAGEAKKLSETIDELTKKLAKLDKRNAELGGDEVRSKALHVRDSVVPAIDAVRVTCDMLERMIPSDLWPLPTYQEMLFVK